MLGIDSTWRKEALFTREMHPWGFTQHVEVKREKRIDILVREFPKLSRLAVKTRRKALFNGEMYPTIGVCVTSWRYARELIDIVLMREFPKLSRAAVKTAVREADDNDMKCDGARALLNEQLTKMNE